MRCSGVGARHMTRLLRIVRRIATVLSLLLCLGLLVAWVMPRKSQRLIWRHHSGPLADFRLASLRGGKLMLAQYRETSISPMDAEFNRLTPLEPKIQPWIEEYQAKLRTVARSPEPHDDRLLAQAAVWQATLTEVVAIKYRLGMHRTFYQLPSKSGLGSGIVSAAGPNRPLRATTEPANYADNLLRRLSDRNASMATWERFGLSYTRGSLPYAYWRIFWIPFWLIFPVLLMLPMYSAWTYRRVRHRRKTG